jgi:hypothetical protein
MKREKPDPVSSGEAVSLLLIGFVYLLVLYPLLFTGQRMFAHDTIWYYGLIRYFYNSMLNGVFPYWDPYNYSGQPFYYNLGIARLFELPSLMVVYVNLFIKGSLLSMYHWDFILRIFLSSLGVYFCFREVNRYTVSNIVVFAAFLMSSFGVSAMRQCGLMTSFMWTPWVLMFLLRLCRCFDLYNIVGLALFTGWSITSYQAGYTLTFMQVFVLAAVFTEPKRVMGLFKDKHKVLLLSAASAIILTLSLQVLSVFIEKDRSVPVLRRDGDPESTSYTETAGGVASTPMDFLSLVLPERIVKADVQREQRQRISEGHLYIGILPLMLAVMGLCFSSGRFKKIFLLATAATVFLMLGGHLKMGAAGKIFFPFLVFARHMQLFQPFFILCLMYFTGQGADFLMEQYVQKKQGQSNAE